MGWGAITKGLCPPGLAVHDGLVSLPHADHLVVRGEEALSDNYSTRVNAIDSKTQLALMCSHV